MGAQNKDSLLSFRKRSLYCDLILVSSTLGLIYDCTKCLKIPFHSLCTKGCRIKQFSAKPKASFLLYSNFKVKCFQIVHPLECQFMVSLWAFLFRRPCCNIRYTSYIIYILHMYIAYTINARNVHWHT